jgi:hypothetical protein
VIGDRRTTAAQQASTGVGGVAVSRRRRRRAYQVDCVLGHESRSLIGVVDALVAVVVEAVAHLDRGRVDLDDRASSQSSAFSTNTGPSAGARPGWMQL